MCNLYCYTKPQDAARKLARIELDIAGKIVSGELITVRYEVVNVGCSKAKIVSNEVTVRVVYVKNEE